MPNGLIARITEPLCRNENVRGVLLTGSRARGDAYPTSDLDLLVLVTSRIGASFCSETVDGMLVEQHIRGLEEAKARLFERSVEPYSCLDGCTVYDPDGLLAELTKAARERFEKYRTPADEKSAIFYWLGSVRLKLSAAMDEDGLQKLGYHSSINSWKVLEGLWALNDRPMPAAGAVWAHVPDLQNAPKNSLASLRKLFEGNPLDRAQTMLELIDWLLEREKGKV